MSQEIWQVSKAMELSELFKIDLILGFLGLTQIWDFDKGEDFASGF